MIAQKESHRHKFSKPATKKVVLASGSKTAIDILKQFKCECGLTVTVDMERNIGSRVKTKEDL